MSFPYLLFWNPKKREEKKGPLHKVEWQGSFKWKLLRRFLTLLVLRSDRCHPLEVRRTSLPKLVTLMPTDSLRSHAVGHWHRSRVTPPPDEPHSWDIAKLLVCPKGGGLSSKLRMTKFAFTNYGKIFNVKIFFTKLRT